MRYFRFSQLGEIVIIWPDILASLITPSFGNTLQSILSTWRTIIAGVCQIFRFPGTLHRTRFHQNHPVLWWFSWWNFSEGGQWQKIYDTRGTPVKLTSVQVFGAWCFLVKLTQMIGCSVLACLECAAYVIFSNPWLRSWGIKSDTLGYPHTHCCQTLLVGDRVCMKGGKQLCILSRMCTIKIGADQFWNW